MQNINRVILTGNLTREPELRALASGMSVCSLRLAVNGRRKDASGEWVDDANFFDVTVFGRQGENAARYLAKGRPVAIDGRLDWREWERDGVKRQAVQVVAESVQFLGGRDGDGGGSGFQPRAASSDVPIDNSDFRPAPADDDIPFKWRSVEFEDRYHANRGVSF